MPRMDIRKHVHPAPEQHSQQIIIFNSNILTSKIVAVKEHMYGEVVGLRSASGVARLRAIVE